MSNDDLDRTVVMPTPGRRGLVPDSPVTPGAEAPAPVVPQPDLRQPSQSSSVDTPALQMVGSSGQNRLVNAATMVFSLARQLRNTAQHQDIEGLLARVVQLIKAFEKNCINQGVDPAVAYEARYVLCAFVDEIVLNTPWGASSVWSHRGLLSSLHNDTSGGERFFQMLAQKTEHPSKHLDMIELMYHCLRLGFQGKFAIQQNGRSALDQISAGLYKTLRDMKGGAEPDLSAQWLGVTDGRPVVAKLVPWWIVAASVVGLLSAIFAVMFFALNSESDDVFQTIGSLGREQPRIVQREASPRLVEHVHGVELLDLIQQINSSMTDELRDKKVSLERLPHALKITLHNKGLFSSGSASVSSAFRPILKKLANQLRALPGPIMVSGHSDSQQIRTLRFPSNWHLSDERARAVVSMLVDEGMQSDDLVAQGKADTEPVATNDTPAGRQQNRRIEILIRSM